MKLTLLGTGGPRPDPDRHASAAALRIGDDTLLFDTGRGVVVQCVRAGLRLADVNPVFLTHHHYDHIGDLADVVITSWLEGREQPLRIYGPPGTTALVNALLQQVYDKDIAFRDHELPNRWPGVEVHDVMGGLVLDAGEWRVFAEVVVHGHGLDFPRALRHRWICLGYRVETADRTIGFSGDCVACSGLGRLARDADLLVQCCYLASSEITTPALARLASKTLACADTVGPIAREARVGKLVLTHFRRKPEALLEEIAAEVSGAFDGPVVVGRDLLEIPL